MLLCQKGKPQNQRLKTHKKESSMAAELSFHREVYNLWVVNIVIKI